MYSQDAEHRVYRRMGGPYMNCKRSGTDGRLSFNGFEDLFFHLRITYKICKVNIYKIPKCSRFSQENDQQKEEYSDLALSN
jgi:hypothetical protein